MARGMDSISWGVDSMPWDMGAMPQDITFHARSMVSSSLPSPLCFFDAESFNVMQLTNSGPIHFYQDPLLPKLLSVRDTRGFERFLLFRNRYSMFVFAVVSSIAVQSACHRRCTSITYDWQVVGSTGFCVLAESCPGHLLSKF
jgi:hypothetical protein